MEESATTIRLADVRLQSDSVSLTVQRSDGRNEVLRLPMTDFILLRLRLEQLANPPSGQSTPLGPQPLQVIRPERIGVLREALSDDPVLIAHLRLLGDLALQIPQAKLLALLQALLPYVSQDEANPVGPASPDRAGRH